MLVAEGVVATWAGARAFATMTLSHGVAQVLLSGRVDCRALIEARLSLARRTEAAAMRAVLLRLDRAIVDIERGEMLSYLRRGAKCPLMRLPRAIVVRPELVPAYRGHAWEAAELGLVRAVFSDAREAEAWVCRRAARAEGYSARSSAR